jgi:hypothetical protein
MRAPVLFLPAATWLTWCTSSWADQPSCISLAFVYIFAGGGVVSTWMRRCSFLPAATWLARRTNSWAGQPSVHLLRFHLCICRWWCGQCLSAHAGALFSHLLPGWPGTLVAEPTSLLCIFSAFIYVFAGGSVGSTWNRRRSVFAAATWLAWRTSSRTDQPALHLTYPHLSHSY